MPIQITSDERHDYQQMTYYYIMLLTAAGAMVALELFTNGIFYKCPS